MDKLAFGVNATDWQERIDFGRMRRERLAKTQAAMKSHDIAVCLLTRPENIRYALGVRGAPEFAPQLRYALVFAEGDPIMYELGDTLAHNRVHCTWIKPENWRYSICWLGGCCGQEATVDVSRQWADGILKDLGDRGLDSEKLGFDSLDGVGAQALQKAGLATTPAMPVMREARRTKTRDEINCMRVAVAIANAAYADLFETARPGLRECDLGGSSMNAQLRAGAEHANAGARSGPNTFETLHIGNTDRIIEVGDLLYMNVCSTNYMGYRVCIYRSFVVGRRPNQKEKNWYKKVYDRVYSVIEEIRPGATTADAAKRFLPASTWGHESEHKMLVSEVGHGIGMTYDEPIISRIWSFDHPQVFEPGMIIAVESREGALGYGGVRLEEMVVVTETGHEIISTWPSEELAVIGRIYSS